MKWGRVHCLFCLAQLSWSAGPACEACMSLLGGISQERWLPCDRCGLPLHGDTVDVSPLICGHCMSDPPVFDALYACVEYNEWRGAALKKFKFQREMIYGECWAYVLDQHLSRLDPSWLKVPWITVPIHWKRYWIRGFNQTDWLLRRIKSLHVMYALQKIKNTRRQSLGHSRERMRRQTGSFRWREGVPIMPHVVLFEDVVTTMSTISEVARVCKSMGVQRVDVVTLMRTLPS